MEGNSTSIFSPAVIASSNSNLSTSSIFSTLKSNHSTSLFGNKRIKDESDQTSVVSSIFTKPFFNLPNLDFSFFSAGHNTAKANCFSNMIQEENDSETPSKRLFFGSSNSTEKSLDHLPNSNSIFTGFKFGGKSQTPGTSQDATVSSTTSIFTPSQSGSVTMATNCLTNVFASSFANCSTQSAMFNFTAATAVKSTAGTTHFSLARPFSAARYLLRAHTDVRRPMTSGPAARRILVRNVVRRLNVNRHVHDTFSQFGRVIHVTNLYAKNSAIIEFDNHLSALNAKRCGTNVFGKNNPVKIFLLHGTSSNQHSSESARGVEGDFSDRALTLLPVSTACHTGAGHVNQQSVAEVAPSGPSLSLILTEFSNEIKRPVFSSTHRLKILELRDKLLRSAENSDCHRKGFIGTCEDMCPEKERYMREVNRLISAKYEGRDADTEVDHRRAVKQYARSSADQEQPLPHELRTSAALQRTMDYLIRHVVSQAHVSLSDMELSDWYHFLWDRTRGIRKDITQLQLVSSLAVQLLEQCARFHIHCSFALAHLPIDLFDSKINNENLTKCLQSLKHLYSDLSLRAGSVCENEAEFRSYDILLNLNHDNILCQIQSYHVSVRSSSHVRMALMFHRALSTNNYVRFFYLLSRCDYLHACLLHRYFFQIRTKAFHIIATAYGPPKRPLEFITNDFMRWMGFYDYNECREFVHLHGDMEINDCNITIDPTLMHQSYDVPPVKSDTFICDKLDSLLTHVINGGELAAVDPFSTYTPSSCFNSDGYFSKELITFNLDQSIQHLHANNVLDSVICSTVDHLVGDYAAHVFSDHLATSVLISFYDIVLRNECTKIYQDFCIEQECLYRRRMESFKEHQCQCIFHTVFESVLSYEIGLLSHETLEVSRNFVRRVQANRTLDLLALSTFDLFMDRVVNQCIVDLVSHQFMITRQFINIVRNIERKFCMSNALSQWRHLILRLRADRVKRVNRLRYYSSSSLSYEGASPDSQGLRPGTCFLDSKHSGLPASVWLQARNCCTELQRAILATPTHVSNLIVNNALCDRSRDMCFFKLVVIGDQSDLFASVCHKIRLASEQSLSSSPLRIQTSWCPPLHSFVYSSDTHTMHDSSLHSGCSAYLLVSDEACHLATMMHQLLSLRRNVTTPVAVLTRLDGFVSANVASFDDITQFCIDSWPNQLDLMLNKSILWLFTHRLKMPKLCCHFLPDFINDIVTNQLLRYLYSQSSDMNSMVGVYNAMVDHIISIVCCERFLSIDWPLDDMLDLPDLPELPPRHWNSDTNLSHLRNLLLHLRISPFDSIVSDRNCFVNHVLTYMQTEFSRHCELINSRDIVNRLTNAVDFSKPLNLLSERVSFFRECLIILIGFKLNSCVPDKHVYIPADMASHAKLFFYDQIPIKPIASQHQALISVQSTHCSQSTLDSSSLYSVLPDSVTSLRNSIHSVTKSLCEWQHFLQSSIAECDSSHLLPDMEHSGQGDQLSRVYLPPFSPSMSDRDILRNLSIDVHETRAAVESWSKYVSTALSQ